MKLQIPVGELLDIVSQVATTLDRKGTPASRMLLRAVDRGEGKRWLYLYSTNTVTETLIKTQADIKEEGQVLIDHSKLHDGLNGLPRDSEVSMETTPAGTLLKVSCGRTRFSIGASADIGEIAKRLGDLPLGQTPTFKLQGSVIAEFIKRTIFCVANDKTGNNAVLQGIRLADGSKGQEAWATDNGIAVCARTGKDNSGLGEVVLPDVALGPLNQLVNYRREEEAEVIRTGNKLVFRFGDAVFATLTLAGKYPNLASIFEERGQAKYNFGVDREKLRGLLLRAGAFTGHARSVEFELRNGELMVKAKSDTSDGSSDALSDAVEVTHSGDKPEESAKIVLGIDYLTNIVGSTKAATLRMGLTGPMEPLIVLDSEDNVDTKYVLMGCKYDGE